MASWRATQWRSRRPGHPGSAAVLRTESSAVTDPVRPVELIAGVARSGPTDPGGPKPGDDTEGAGEEPLLRPSYLFGANIRLYYSEDSGLILAHERLYPDNNSAIIGTPFKKTVKGFWAPLLWYSPRIPHPLLVGPGLLTWCESRCDVPA
jgi:hypothetical protein